jgi:hypothetical protein
VSFIQAARNVARRIARLDSGVRIPKNPTQSLHQGTLTAVDIGTNTVHFEHNASGVVIPGVRYLVAYTPDHPPSVDDVVWLQKHGTDQVVLGRHVVPDSTVTFP